VPAFYFRILNKRKDCFYSHLYKANMLTSDIWCFCWHRGSLHVTWATNSIHFHFWGKKSCKSSI